MLFLITQGILENCDNQVFRQNIKEYMQMHNLKINKIKPDGHCLLNSVIFGLKDKNINLNIIDIQQANVNEFLTSPNDYIEF